LTAIAGVTGGETSCKPPDGETIFKTLLFSKNLTFWHKKQISPTLYKPFVSALANTWSGLKYKKPNTE
jgi:hypothetical protein